MTANNPTSPTRTMQRGVTLLENMVALLVISVGMLGFAGMQAFTLQGSASTTHRQLAMQLAQDMADRIRANPGAYFDVSDKTINHYDGIAPSAKPTAPKDCRSQQCTAKEIAAFDIWDWQLANHPLPGDDDVAGGYVSSKELFYTDGKTPLLLSPGLPQRKRFTIAILWDGNGTGSTTVSADPTDCTKAGELKCYALVIDL